MEVMKWLNRRADPGDLNRCIFRSRRRTGICEFSARLFLRRPCSWRAVNLSLDSPRTLLVSHQHVGREALFL